MTFCLVTDRRTLSTSSSLNTAHQCLLAQARFAVDAGIGLLQVRERDLESRELARLVDDLVLISRGSRTRIVVNDRLDVALACGADGVHLRSDSLAAADVRRIAPAGFLVGRSIHRLEETAMLGAVDYVIAGTVFESTSKPEQTSNELLGLDGLAAIAKAVDIPVYAIGGISAQNARLVIDAGAAGLAGIGLFLDRTAVGCRAVPLAPRLAAIGV